MITTLLGKDAPLEDTLANVQAKMLALGAPLSVKSTLQSVPHCYSNHIGAPDYPMFFSNGKGKTELAAQCSGFAEYVERLGSGYFFIDYALPSAQGFTYAPDEQWLADKSSLLNQKLWAVYDPGNELDEEDLLDFCSDEFERLVGVPLETPHGDQAIFPVNLLHHLYASNGLSAGNTQAEAQVQGLSEIFERAIKNRIIAQGLNLADVPEKVVQSMPEFAEGIAFIKSQGYRVWVKDASLGGKYPVACVAVEHPETGGVFVNFGAHPKMEVAFERTLTEILQGRSLKDISDFPQPAQDLDDVSDEDNLILHFIDSSGLIHQRFFEDGSPDFDYVSFDFSGDTSSELAALLRLVDTEGFTPYLRSNNRFGLWVSQIIVPGFSEVYPMDMLLVHNHNIGKWLRAPILSVPTLSQDEREELAENIEQHCEPSQKVMDVIGLACLPDSPWRELRVGGLIDLLRHSDVYTSFTQAPLESELFDADNRPIGDARDNLLQFHRQVYQQGWMNE